MTRVTVDASDLARATRGLSERTMRKVVIKGVNSVGAHLRRRIPEALQDQIQARRIKTRTKARAAFSGSSTPKYSLWLPARIPVKDLKTGKFKSRGRGGRRRVQFSFKGFDNKTIRFGNVRREGKGAGRRVVLLPAGGKPERAVGGVPIPRRGLLEPGGPVPGAAAAVDEARDIAVAKMAEALVKATSRAGRR